MALEKKNPTCARGRRKAELGPNPPLSQKIFKKSQSKKFVKRERLHEKRNFGLVVSRRKDTQAKKKPKLLKKNSGFEFFVQKRARGEKRPSLQIHLCAGKGKDNERSKGRRFQGKGRSPDIKKRRELSREQKKGKVGGFYAQECQP